MQFRAPHYDSLPVHIFIYQNPPRFALSQFEAEERRLTLHPEHYDSPRTVTGP